jgi:gamma-aminobutyric acid type B receptor
VGLSIFTFTWLVALAAIVAVMCLRKDPIVQGAQPFFLIAIFVGSMITSAAIFTLSWDDQSGVSVEVLDVACMATQWTFFIGHVTTYMALFSKLRRVDQVLQFRRRAVTIRQVMGPLVVLMTVTLVLLCL